MKQKTNHNVVVPEPTLRRLPWYLAYLQLIKGRGEAMVSSTQIARSTGVDPALVAKDLSFVSIVGKTRVGYDVQEIVAVLEDFLGFDNQHRAYILGVGNLGAALMHDKGLVHYGMDIVGGFDVRESVIGSTIGGSPVYHIDQLPEVKTPDVTIGIITVPIDVAQSVTDWAVEAGLTAIWNFTPSRILVPKGITLQNTSIYSHLAVMYHRIEEKEQRKR